VEYVPHPLALQCCIICQNAVSSAYTGWYAREESRVEQTTVGPAATRPNMIEMRGATKQFGQAKVIDDVSLSVEQGTIYSFIGPSGSGKTTVIRLLNGVYAPTSGEITVMSKSPHQWSQRDRERIGYMPQLFALYPNLSVNENIDFAASTYGLGWWARREPKRHLLEFVNLWEHRHKLARSVSGGMKRRLELACALVHDPTLVFLDEPTAGIDPVLRASIWEHLKGLRGQGKTLFVTTQYVTEAEYCDRVGLINKGRLIADGTPDELRKQAFNGEIIRLSYERLDSGLLREIEDLPEVVDGLIRRLAPTTAEMVAEEASIAMPLILKVMTNRGIPLEAITIEEIKPPFDDVFVRLIHDDTARMMEQPQ
jgi:ABC-2 type transport system ATP-binding protein